MKKLLMPMSIACLLALMLPFAAVLAEEAPAAFAVTPEDVVFWTDASAGLATETLPGGDILATWPAAPDAAYYYLVICEKGFVQGDPYAGDKSLAWGAGLWDKHAAITDATQKVLSIIAEYDASLWCRADANELTYEPSDVLTTLVYAQNGVAYEMVQGKIVASASGPQIVSTLENLFVFYVRNEAPEGEEAVVQAENGETAGTPASAAPDDSVYAKDTAAPDETANAGDGGSSDEFDPDEMFIGYATVTNKNPVNLRRGDTTEFGIVSRAQPGSILLCLGITQRGWYAVFTDTLDIAYVASSMVEFTPTGKYAEMLAAEEEAAKATPTPTVKPTEVPATAKPTEAPATPKPATPTPTATVKPTGAATAKPAN